MPTVDDFDGFMNLSIDVGSTVLTVVSNDRPIYEVQFELTQRADTFVFTSGNKLAEVNIVGWLPSEYILQAPLVVGKGRSFVVDGQCTFPMPEVVDFTDEHSFAVPPLNVPSVWDYNLHALWTPLGFHVYDDEAKETVVRADAEIKA